MLAGTASSTTTVATKPGKTIAKRHDKLKSSSKTPRHGAEEATTFASLAISEACSRAIRDVLGFEYLTKVQSMTLPLATAGHDIIAKARTGSGKTLAFLLPTIEFLAGNVGSLGRGVHAIALSPTRELAGQIQLQCASLIRFQPELSSRAVMGGSVVKLDVQLLRKKPPNVLIATPGRLHDLLLNHGLEKIFRALRVLVLDEADQLLGLGFQKEINSIVSALDQLRPATSDRQTLLFSATLPEDVCSLARSVTRKGKRRIVDTIGAGAGALQTNAQVQQSVTVCTAHAHGAELLALLRQLGSSATDRPRQHKVLVFFPTARMVRRASSPTCPGTHPVHTIHRIPLCSHRLMYVRILRTSCSSHQPRTCSLQQVQLYATLIKSAISSAPSPSSTADEASSIRILEMHSRLSQAARTNVAADFRSSRCVMLFSTDISARGLDYPGVTAVVQVGIPTNRAQYIHRLGRTGRAGKAGSGYLLLSESEKPFLHVIADLPLTHRPALAPAAAKALQASLSSARSTVPPELVAASYQSWLGFYYKQFTTLQWSKEELARHANTFSRAVLGLASPPPLEEAALRNMGLLGVAGMHQVGEADGGDDGRGGSSARWREGAAEEREKQRRLSGATWLSWMAKESGEVGGGGGYGDGDGRLGDTWDYSTAQSSSRTAHGGGKRDGGHGKGGSKGGRMGKGGKGGRGGKGGITNRSGGKGGGRGGGKGLGKGGGRGISKREGGKKAGGKKR